MASVHNQYIRQNCAAPFPALPHEDSLISYPEFLLIINHTLSDGRTAKGGQMHARFVENDRRTRMGEKKKVVRVDVAARGKRTSLELLGKLDCMIRVCGRSEWCRTRSLSSSRALSTRTSKLRCRIAKAICRDAAVFVTRISTKE